ncbi:TatD family hydrolase [Candidatus Saccharibacteria bacterium]|nr:TatD family hydrolase [Candidatus Saccharibacteria bacterium]
MLVDTHAHIHFDEFTNDLSTLFDNCRAAQVETIITVGTNDTDSRDALNFSINPLVLDKAKGIKIFATVGIHPHDAKLGEDAFLSVKELTQNEDYEKTLVAIGECGLDYCKNFSSQAEQFRMLEWQLELAQECDLPVIFHVRDAWDDFFAIIKKYPKTRGVIHSFTGGLKEVELANALGVYFGMNGIMTFTKDSSQLEAVKLVSQDKLLLETDCPFLTPVPYRGKRNEPSFVSATATFIADLREQQLTDLVSESTNNAKKLFTL